MIDAVQYLIDRLEGKAPKGARRSREWRNVRAAHLKKAPRCYVCGGKKKIEVHHIVPFHVAPDLELNPSNLLTLCERGKYGIKCHQLVGHLGNYQRVNANVRRDGDYMRALLDLKGFRK